MYRRMSVLLQTPFHGFMQYSPSPTTGLAAFASDLLSLWGLKPPPPALRGSEDRCI